MCIEHINSAIPNPLFCQACFEAAIRRENRLKNAKGYFDLNLEGRKYRILDSFDSIKSIEILKKKSGAEMYSFDCNKVFECVLHFNGNLNVKLDGILLIDDIIINFVPIGAFNNIYNGTQIF